MNPIMESKPNSLSVPDYILQNIERMSYVQKFAQKDSGCGA
jgi:hypothetical protein